MEFPRSSVTEFTRITAVPVFPDETEGGPPEGSPGDYEIDFVLGIPGISTVTESLHMRMVLHSGDSLVSGSAMTISRSGDPTVRILTNDKGHYSNIRIKLHAASRSDAERASIRPRHAHRQRDRISS